VPENAPISSRACQSYRGALGGRCDRAGHCNGDHDSINRDGIPHRRCGRRTFTGTIAIALPWGERTNSSSTGVMTVQSAPNFAPWRIVRDLRQHRIELRCTVAPDFGRAATKQRHSVVCGKAFAHCDLSGDRPG